MWDRLWGQLARLVRQVRKDRKERKARLEHKACQEPKVFRARKELPA
jgi:hypothetical protein